MLSAEIIAIGSELLTPTKTDTNSLWLTEKLNDIGIEVMLKTIVGDDGARLEETVRDALKRSDVVITTGGLGPTADDNTREFTAAAVGRELVYHEDIEQHLRERFRSWGREMPEINKRQAYVIDGADILPNPNGSAVGMLAEMDGKMLIILPGPPRENQPMFTDHVFGRLKAIAGEVFVKRRILRVSGLGESAVDEIAAPIYMSYESVQTSILFNKSEVEIHIAARADTEAEAVATCNKLADELIAAIGKPVFATHGETMEEIVGAHLIRRGETVSVAESCTGGLIGQRITAVAGSSRYFLEGAVTYSNEAKMRTLGVPAEILERHGAVSAECAEAMADGMRAYAGTDHAISVTGIAGPDGGTDEKPVGTVFIGYSGAKGTKSVRLNLPGDRYLIRWRTSQAALDYLRRQIMH
ncbi:MAG: competence/damage-inducible protein A [Pyrinomonadaceae bacterium]|nr:competence/damage-inducible protein A [Pyrinomonadaceae bacterium]MBP6214304.1 competence/damage-inducible protein A [Pyrinomonadaceae bacterium]